MDELEPFDIVEKGTLVDNMCRCTTCCSVFKISECPTDRDHHDGWEMPAYTEILCTVCDDGGCIDDFWYKELNNG